MKILFYSIVLVVIGAFIGLFREAGSWLVKEDKLTHADAIVILMGSIADRVLQADDVFKKEACKIIIVEENMEAYRILEQRGIHIISNTKQVYDALKCLGVPPDSIHILPGDATSTKMEATIIRDYLITRPAIDTVILVSSSFHTRRAYLIFHTALKKAKKQVCILCSPSAYTSFNADKWWIDKEGIQDVLTEYVKLFNFLLFEKRRL
jgi:uncharacterized SAM-binding protein YcdF (DUF218 family)